MTMVAVEPGLRINCEVADYLWPWTQATPVVMMHGFSRNASVWDRWVPTLAQTHRVYRPEYRGCGKSEIPPESFLPNPKSLVADGVAFLDGMGFDRVHWVGESAGAFIGVMLAAAHPERVASLTLCEMPMAIPAEVGQKFSLGTAKPSDAIRKLGMLEWCRQTVTSRADPNHATPELTEWYAHQLGKTPTHVGAGLMDVFSTLSIEPYLKDVRCPVFALFGDKSKSATPEHMATLLAAIPKAETHVFPGYAHGINILVPEAAAKVTSEFLNRVESA